MPGMEAHGGYTFCGMAALVILKKEHLLNLQSLLVSGTIHAWWPLGSQLGVLAVLGRGTPAQAVPCPSLCRTALGNQPADAL